MIWLGWTSNCWASSASVFSPLTAAKATFALKAGVWFRRGRLLIVSPALRPSWPPSGRNSTYPTCSKIPSQLLGHGQTREATTVEAVANRLRSLAVGAGVASAATSFGYMFPELHQDEANVLKPERATVEALRALGAAMTDVP